MYIIKMAYVYALMTVAFIFGIIGFPFSWLGMQFIKEAERLSE